MARRNLVPPDLRATAGTTAPLLMTVAELSKETQVSTKTIRRWVALGEVPGIVRLPGGRGARLRRADVMRWIASGCKS